VIIIFILNGFERNRFFSQPQVNLIWWARKKRGGGWWWWKPERERENRERYKMFG